MPIVNSIRRINPLDLNKNVTIGVAFPLDETNLFSGTETIKEQVEDSMINVVSKPLSQVKEERKLKRNIITDEERKAFEYKKTKSLFC